MRARLGTCLPSQGEQEHRRAEKKGASYVPAVRWHAKKFDEHQPYLILRI